MNVFTTWCSPCVNEIPELEKLYEEMKEKGVGVVGVVLDTVSDDAKQNEDTVKKSRCPSGEDKSILSVPGPGFNNDEWTFKWYLCFPGNILC